MHNQGVENVLSSLVEVLAAIEHERWSHWQNHLHSKCIANPDGTLTIPSECAERWSKQASTPYADLTESERESDRDQVRQYLPVIAAALKAAC